MLKGNHENGELLIFVDEITIATGISSRNLSAAAVLFEVGKYFRISW